MLYKFLGRNIVEHYLQATMRRREVDELCYLLRLRFHLFIIQNWETWNKMIIEILGLEGLLSILSLTRI